MQRVPRAISIGIIAGAILFFVPFLIGFFFFILFAGLLFRFLFFGFRRRRHFGYHPYFTDNRYGPSNNIVPIERQWYNAPIQGKGKETTIPIH